MRMLALVLILLSGCATLDSGEKTAVAVVGASLASQTTGVCAHYPCAHLGHLGLGALVGYVGAKEYDEATAWKWGLIFAIGKEVLDVLIGKPFSAFDALQRLAGVAAGVALAQPDTHDWQREIPYPRGP